MSLLPINRLLTKVLSLCFLGVAASIFAGEQLPQSITFQGKAEFEKLSARAVKEDWRALPMGERVAKIGYAMRGTPYKGFTLEIDDKVESPSANFNAVDCWTYFEIALGMARMIETPKESYTPSDLLHEIEWTRYRGGNCSGRYLDRMHYLAEWWYDNEARGDVQNVTALVGPTIPLVGRKIQEMTVLWKSYRYLRNSPELLPEMGQIERREEQLPFHFIPKAKVKECEAKIQSGDIIGIVTNQTGGHCSHVGLAYRTEDGVCHFMHASKNYGKVTLDKSLSGYLMDFRYHAGIIVARPQPRSSTVTDSTQYRTRLGLLERN